MTEPKQPKTLKGVAQRERRNETKLVKQLAKDGIPTQDSFVNFAQKMGIGADNPLTSSGYGFNPITRIRTLLEWIHRGSWLGGVAVDVVADDMTRAGVEIKSKMTPKKIDAIEESSTSLAVWDRINDVLKWGRLYGGALGVHMVDGQNYATPLRMETVGKGQYKGVMALDRWMVEPSISNLVREQGPNMGLPMFYTITNDAPGLNGQKVHYTRVFRHEGIRLPYWQRVMENLWGISVLERLYDRMVAFDSASTGAAQLVYKSYLRTYKIEGLRNIIAAGGPALNGVSAYVDMMRRFQSLEGMTLLDTKDEFDTHGTQAFSGLSDALQQFAQQLAGALQIPLVRLFGQSPSGFNSGDTDLRMYYDGIKQQQVKVLLVAVTHVYRLLAQSEGFEVPEGFKIQFRPLWQITDKEKGEISTTMVDAIVKAQEAGLISDKVAMQELRASSDITGVFTNITDKDINAADDVPVPAAELAMPGDEEGKGGGEPVPEPSAPKPKQGKKLSAKDSVSTISDMLRLHDLHVVIENPKGSVRTGDNWQVTMPADYGYLRKTLGADGDQVDCFIGPDHSADAVYIIHQQRANDLSQFDEHKVMLGYPDMRAALVDYVGSYSDGRAWDRIGKIETMRMDEFKAWMARKAV